MTQKSELTSTNRRLFLQHSASLPFLAWLGGGLSGCSSAEVQRYAGLQTFGPTQALVLERLSSAVLARLENETLPLQIVKDVDQAVSGDSELMQSRLNDALLFLEWSPLASRFFGRFSNLEPSQRLEVLEAFAGSRFKIKRTVHQALVSLVVYTYASYQSVWDEIGYDGPWVGRSEKGGTP